MSENVVPFKYKAFLSYSHRDRKWGEWLHRSLENYKIEKDLVGRETPAGPVPKTLRPIFRDRDDFAAGPSLTEQTLAALEASQFLIVVCSPNSAKSEYVNEEIRRFKALDRTERVIAIIVDGEPGDAERECSPPALRFKVAPEGTLTDERDERIAADVRPNGDGKPLALKKVVGGLLGLGLDEIVHRAERAQKRRNRFWAGLAGIFLLLAVVATSSAIYAWQLLRTNQAFLNATLKTATEIVNTAVIQAEKYNVPRTATLELLAKAEALFDDMARLGRPTPTLQYRKALMLIEFARNFGVLGKTEVRRARVTEAHRLLQGLAAEDVGNVALQRDLAVTYSELGDVLAAQGNIPEALISYRDGLAIRQRLIKADSQNIGWQRDLSVSYERIGIGLVAQGNLPEALKLFRDGLAIMERLAAADFDNTGFQRGLLIAHIHVGDTLRNMGKLSESLAQFRNCLTIAKRLSDADPNSHRWQSDQSQCLERTGHILLAQGNPKDALSAYRGAVAAFERLVNADPNNTEFQRGLSFQHLWVGDTLYDQSNFDEALAAYRSCLAIRERMARIDPTNADWQTYLSQAQERIGYVYLAQDKLPDALEVFRQSLVLRERLAISDYNNAPWQRDFSISYNTVGSVLFAQGDLSEALTYFRSGLAIALRLAKADPGNMRGQHDLVLSHNNIGHVLAAQGNLPDALFAYRGSLDIAERLAAFDPSNAKWQDDLNLAIRRIGGLAYNFVLARDFARALEASDQAIALAPDEIWINSNRAHALMFLGRSEEARALYLKYRGKEARHGKSWESIISGDFSELRGAGLSHPLMDEIEAQYAARG